MDESAAYTTIKDQKENFPDKPNFRLVNSSKSDIGKVSKSILINGNNSQNTNLNRWRNSISVIEWFKAIDNKPQLFFFIVS